MRPAIRKSRLIHCTTIHQLWAVTIFDYDINGGVQLRRLSDALLEIVCELQVHDDLQAAQWRWFIFTELLLCREWIGWYIRARGPYAPATDTQPPLGRHNGFFIPRRGEKITHSDLNAVGARLLLISFWYYYHISMSLGI